MKFIRKLINNLSIEELRGKLNLVGKAQTTIISAAFVLFVSSGLSAVLGLVKGRLLTASFGVSEELGIFYTADRIPNLIYSVLVVGALSTIFIPVFTELITKNKKQAWEAASSIIIVGFGFFAVISLLAMIFAPQIISALALGEFDEQQIWLGADLMRIMIVAQIILVLSSFSTCILQSFKLFLAPAMAPVVYNLGMILGVVFLSDTYGMYGPAYGVIIGALLHFAIQLPALRKLDFNFELKVDLKNKGIRSVFKLIPPRILSVVLNQSISTISNSLAILVSTSSVVILKFSSQLQFFPVHLFGASMAAASLPVLSELAGHDNKSFKKVFITTLHQTLFMVMPASMLLLILRVPIVRLVYGVENFPWEATIKTAYTLAFFSVSIFAQSVVYLCTRAFYAQKDTMTPVKISILSLILNTSVAVYMITNLGYGVWSIALSYSLASLAEMSLLIFFLSKKLGGFTFEELLIPFIKISYATVFMGMFIYTPLKVLDEQVFDTSRTINLLILTILVTIAGSTSYILFTKFFNVTEIELLYKLLRKFKLRSPEKTIPATVVSSTSDNI